MKTKALHTFCIILIMLVSMHFSNVAFGANPDTLYRHITINLDYFYGKKSIRELKDRLYNAGLKYELKPYKTDSISSILSPEEVISKRTYEAETQPFMGGEPENPLIDTVIYNLSELTSFSINFKTWFNSENNNFKLDITCLSLNYDLIISGQILADLPLFYISKADLIKVLGSTEAEELFKNCYLAMLKAINYEKLDLPESVASFNVDLGKYIGEITLNEMNEKMYNAVIKGITGTGKHIPAYKTDELTTFYTVSEVLDRGSITETLKIPDPKDPTEEKLIDTTIKVAFYSYGNKSYSLSYKFSYDTKKTIVKAEISAFGFYVPIQNSEGKTNNGTFFWIKWKDAEAIYTPIELSVLKYAFYRALVNFQDYHLK